MNRERRNYTEWQDPTAWAAIRNVRRPPEDHSTVVPNASDLAAQISTLSNELKGLNQRRRLKKITRGEYAELRTPLVTDYHALLQVHLARKGGG